MAFSITRLSPACGAEVHGVDLSRPVSDDVISEIRQELLTHQVLFFRDQELTLDQHKDLGRRFGELHIHPAAPAPEGHPELLVIHADENSKRVAGEAWHSDVSCEAEPPMGSLLHIHTVPDLGGDTLFASMYAAYEALSDKMQSFLSGLTALHGSEHVYRGRYYEEAKGARHENPANEHPVVRTHPETGRQALFVNQGFTTRIVGMKRGESQALLAFLFDHVKNPLFQCRFRWQPNSLAFWDNRAVQHLALFDYFPQVRHGYRVTIQGDRPFYRPNAAEPRRRAS